MTAQTTTRAGRLVLRCAAVGVALLLPLALVAPASAETDVVRDDRKDGGLRSMTVERSPYRLQITTSFARASDLHTFGVKEPGYTVPTFRISWHRDRPTVIRVATARDTPTREKGVGTCRVRRARYDGPGATRLSFTVPGGCLWIYEFEELPRYKVNQRSFDVVDGVKRLDDELDYTRMLTRRR